MPTPTVSLQDLVTELTLTARRRRKAVDVRTGRIVDLDALEEAVGGAAAEHVERGVYVPLPPEDAVRLPELARRFALEHPDDDVREALLWSLRGRGGLFCFRDTLTRLELTPDWTAVRDRHVAEFAVAWLGRQGLDYARDLAPWGRLRRL